MSVLLRIDSSARIEGSHSRALGDHAQSLWEHANPAGRVINRDLAERSPANRCVDIIRAETIIGFQTRPEALTPALREALRLSDELIAELQSADTLMITTPIYNFSVPSALKAWIDQITRSGHTFSYRYGVYRGLVKANRAIVICAYGTREFCKGQRFADADFLQPYLQFLLSTLGVQSVDFVSAHGTTTDPKSAAAIIEKARAELDRLFARDGIPT